MATTKSDDKPDGAASGDELTELNRRIAEEAAKATTADARNKQK